MRVVRLLWLVSLVYAVAPSTVAAQEGNKAPRMPVCHVTDNGGFHLINIDGNALPEHLAHGDQNPELVPLTLPSGTTFSASGSWEELPSRSLPFAFDGNLTTEWNAGGWPEHWIQVTFGTPLKFNLLTALIDQIPNSFTNHDVTFDGSPAFSWTGYTVNGQLLSQSFGAMQNVQTVRITTTASESWVAWVEIAFYDGTVACPGS